MKQTFPSNNCRVCGASLWHVFVDLGMVPLCQTYVEPRHLDKGEMFYPLRATVCTECFYVGLPEYVSAKEIFTEYAYFSSYSDSWMKYIKESADAMVDFYALGSNSQVVEMASNDGYLLQHFVEKGIPALGVEPAANVAKVANEKGVPTLAQFFSGAMARELRDAGKAADLFLAYNCLDHVPDINDVVAGMRILLKPTGVAHVEFPYLRALIEGNQFDTIYHDRYSYLSLFTVCRIFERNELEILDAERIPTHGGSLRIRACHAKDKTWPRSDQVAQLLAAEKDCGMQSTEYYAAFMQKVKDTKRNLLELLFQLKRQGKSIVGYGIPAKGNVLLNYCGIRTDFLDYVVDRSPYKQGKYTPGTRIEIREVEQIRLTKPDYLLVLPWNIKEEVMQQMSFICEWGGRFIVPIPTVQVI